MYNTVVVFYAYEMKSLNMKQLLNSLQLKFLVWHN